MTKTNNLKSNFAEVGKNMEENTYNTSAGNISLIAGISTKLFNFSNKNLESLSKGYVWDSLSTFAIYNLLSATGRVKNEYVSAGISFGVPCLAEILQKFDLISGVYDSKDFIAYGIGAGLALGIDKTVKYLSKKRQLEKVL
jgi:hypothetical protein